MIDFIIHTKEDLKEAIDAYGILPFFANEIKGFSIEEHCDPKVYFGKEPGVWEWKGPIIQEMKCAYGKFFLKKAAFVKRIRWNGRMHPSWYSSSDTREAS